MLKIFIDPYVPPKKELILATKKRYYVKRKISASILDGKKYCAWCGKLFKGRKYCSEQCRFSSDIYCKPHSKLTKKYVLIKQDNKCAVCGFDYTAYVYKGGNTRYKCFRYFIRWSKIPSNKRLETDHKTAICNGGNPIGIENLRVLCKECHKKKTREDRDKKKQISVDLLRHIV